LRKAQLFVIILAIMNKKPLILIVDDELFMREVFRTALEEAGFMVTTATDGEAALSSFLQLQPDLVLLDLIMPGKDGFATCQEIRCLPDGKYTPILMVTGRDDTELVHRAFEAGATDFISKPVNTDLLAYRIRYMLRASGTIKSLAESEERLAKAQKIAQLGNWEWNPFNGAFWGSAELLRILGIQDRLELSSLENFLFAVDQSDKELVETGLKTALQSKSSCNFECSIRRPDETLRLVRLHGRAERTVTGKVSRLVGTLQDITDVRQAEDRLKNAEEKINHLACFDLLTGLPNRAMLLDRLRKALLLASRENEKLSLFFLDLDSFKDVNDTQGHDFGDKLLREVATRLHTCLQESDTLARLGGDEFVVVMTAVDNQDSAAAAAQRMLALFAQPFEIDGRQIYSSTSIGIAFYPDDSKDASSLFKCADTAMYHAKNDGRGQFRFFSEKMNEKIMRRVALENSLRHGIKNREFFLLYQPQWDLKTSKMVGVEALLRWQSTEFGLMPPAEFIGLLEDSGLILSIGEWVLRSACLQAREWTLAGQPGFRVAVNVSGKQLKQAEFLELLTRIIQETGVDPGALELEFTESIIMDNAGKTIETLGALSKMGIQLSIDDFGTGYSSLNYLRHFPIDRIKIDRSFVTDVNRSKDDAAIVEAIISMAQTLNLKVVAEGIENSDQLHVLASLGCNEVQGFYLAKPMTAEALAENLAGLHGNEVGKLAETGWFAGR
jgi:diguanylate cyclase (GGDEF)-like protein